MQWGKKGVGACMCCMCVRVCMWCLVCMRVLRREKKLSLVCLYSAIFPQILIKKNALTNIFSLKMIGRSKRGRGEHVGIPPKTRRKRQEIKFAFAFVFVMFFMFFVFGLCRYHKKRHPPHTQLKPLINYTTPVELMHIFRDRHRRGIRDTGYGDNGQRSKGLIAIGSTCNRQPVLQL